jgi:hypothetical protein
MSWLNKNSQVSEMQATAGTGIAKRLQKLAKLYERQQASETMTRALDKLLDYEAAFSRSS